LHVAREDGAVNLATVAAGPTEPARVLVAEFGLIFADDWYMLPIALPANTLARVTKLEVLDTFGNVTPLKSCAETDGPSRDWRFFELTGDDTLGAPWLYIAPAVAAGLTGIPIEHVLLARDEAANLAWAIERQVEDPLGNPIERKAVARNSERPDEPRSSWSYRAESPTPLNWIPFVPVSKGRMAHYKLRRGRMEQWGDDPRARVQGSLRCWSGWAAVSARAAAKVATAWVSIGSWAAGVQAREKFDHVERLGTRRARARSAAVVAARRWSAKCSRTSRSILFCNSSSMLVVVMRAPLACCDHALKPTPERLLEHGSAIVAELRVAMPRLS
jgi:hypothetical protein